MSFGPHDLSAFCSLNYLSTFFILILMCVNYSLSLCLEFPNNCSTIIVPSARRQAKCFSVLLFIYSHFTFLVSTYQLPALVFAILFIFAVSIFYISCCKINDPWVHWLQWSNKENVHNKRWKVLRAANEGSAFQYLLNTSCPTKLRKSQTSLTKCSITSLVNVLCPDLFL